MKSVLAKLFGIYVITTALLIFVIFYFSFDEIRNNTIQNLNVQINHLNRAVSVQTIPYLKSEDYQSLDSLVKVIGKNSESRITIILPDGKVVADNEKNPSTMENHSDRAEIIDAQSKGTGESMRYSYTVHQKMLYNAVRIMSEDKLIGFSRVSLPIHNMDDMYSGIMIKIITITSVVFLISLILLYLFSRYISGNINRLVEASNKIAAGDFDSKVYLNTRDELRTLGNNFNNMSGKLKDLFTEVNKKQEEITSIIKSIQDGIIVIDMNGRVVLCNENFRKYFDLQEIKNNYYWVLVRDLNFQKLIKKIQNTKESRVTEIQHHGNYYLASGSWNDMKKEVVVIVYDINDMKRLEQVKKDFIVNVSHELKTPLTAIKGFVETLQDEANNEQKYYLNIIERQTQRLIYIVQDLLLLSKLENPETSLQLKDVDIAAVCDNIFKLFKSKAIEKKISMVRNIPENAILRADEYMIEQVLINLIENALKFTNFGSITVGFKFADDRPVLTVTDTGSGIPREHLPRIFERFYTVDKSHTKTISGTGLGLSIVKHIVNLHGGEIICDSTVGKGTTFTIYF